MMTKLIFWLGALAAGNLLLAFLIQSYVFLKVGPGVATDALYASMTVPQLIVSVLTGSLFYVVVPLLAGEDEEHLCQSAWSFFLLIAGTLGAVSLVLYLLAPFWIPLLLPGFSQAGLALAQELTRIQLIGMVFSALSYALRAVYHARQIFFRPEVMQLIGSVIALCVMIWVLPRFGIQAAAWVSVLQAVMQTFFLMPGLGNYSKPDWNQAVMREAWRRILPLTLGALYYKSGALVDRFLTSMVPAGGLSLFYLSQQIYGTAAQLISKAAVGPMLPQLAVRAKTGMAEDSKCVSRSWVFGLTCLAALIGLFVLWVGSPLLRLWAGINEEDLRNFWWIMVALVGVFIGGVMGQIFASAFYAKGNVSIPVKVGTIGFTVGIVLKTIGFSTCGLPGIAFGTTLYYLGNTFALYFLLKKDEDALSH